MARLDFSFPAAQNRGFLSVLLATLSTPLAACGGAPPPVIAPEAPVDRHTLRVNLDARTVSVDIATLAQPGARIPLLAVWKAGFPGEAPGPLRFDLLGSDGFRPRSKSACKDLLTGDQASHAQLDPVTHDVTFVGGTSLAPCYDVRDLVEIDGVR